MAVEVVVMMVPALPVMNVLVTGNAAYHNVPENNAGLTPAEVTAKAIILPVLMVPSVMLQPDNAVAPQ